MYHVSPTQHTPLDAYINLVVQLCLHHILRDEVGGMAWHCSSAATGRQTLVVRMTKVADNLLPKRRKKPGNCILYSMENFSADSLGY